MSADTRPTDEPLENNPKEALKKELLRQIITMRDIPTIPAVMHKILETLSDESSSAEELTGILESDPAICTSVLRLANSAFYGLSKTVDSIQRAVVLIGYDSVEMLALATSVLTTFGDVELSGLDSEDFWMHALGTAKAAQLLSKSSGLTDEAEMCFTAGLLHDLGKLLSSLALPEAYGRLLKAARDREMAVHKVERKAMGIDNAFVGAWVAEKWLFPSVIVEVIRHQYMPSSRWPNKYNNQLHLILLAEKITKAASYGLGGDPDEGLAPSDLPPTFNMEFSDLLDLVTEMEDKYDETREVLNLITKA